jgi:hypothetical protein
VRRRAVTVTVTVTAMAVAAAALAVAAAALLGCGRGGGGGRKVATLERTIASGLSEQLGVSIARVECPDGARASDPFRCTAFAGEDAIAIAVEPEGPPEERGVRWRTDGLVLRLDRLATHVAAELEDLGFPAIVECGGALRMGAVGELVECGVTYADGTKSTASARVVGEEGDFDLTLGSLPAARRPPSPPSPPAIDEAPSPSPAIDEGPSPSSPPAIDEGSSPPAIDEGP